MQLSSWLSAHMRLLWLFAALFLSALTAALHAYAIEHFLYWTYRWLDGPMHVLGGAVIGSFFVAVSNMRRPLAYLSAMLAIAIGWEVMEYVAGLTNTEAVYWLDTMQDLLNDAIGVILVYLLARFSIWRSN